MFLFVFLSFINHSCDGCNTKILFNGKRDNICKIIAIKNIKKGEELTRNYMNKNDVSIILIRFKKKCSKLR